MRLRFLMMMAALVAIVMCGTIARGQKHRVEKPEKPEKAKDKIAKTVIPQEERTVAVEPGVVITLCMDSGSITVRGSDRREVRALFPKGTKIDFGREGDANSTTPATRLEVLVSEPAVEDEEEEPHFGRCSGAANIELDVPREATLFFKSADANLEVDAVAEAHLETNGGKISMRRVTRAIEATSIEGDVLLEDSSGRVSLESFNGSVEAINVSKTAEGDFFRAKTISNDVMLERVTHSRVEVSTISGEITMTGPLARYAQYDLKTTSGDITLTMPVNSSFRLTARVSEGGEIVTDFPLKYSSGLSTDRLLSTGQMIGTHGKGDATINLASFSGTLRLRRQ
ncbi:MAG TPA: DUF4097 family beta strand repeat-containing protein [Pyrinomonadaceae bacterium]|nr:DUF4097 family beta strand repeat-containing protein [Pyrinomonadaceae bacterium]